jgi:hypothetical protein
MSSIIRIKRSTTAGAPPVLRVGELAYSFADSLTISGGDRLYIGGGSESGDPLNAAERIVVGGKYFTDMLDHARGTLTANSALLVDGDKRINELLVDNITIDGNTISSTNSNGSITLDPAGSGFINLITDDIVIGKEDANVTIITNGRGDLILTTGADSDAGSITIGSGDNEDIIISANGSGSVTMPKVNIDSGTIDGVSIGTNSVATEIRVDNIQLNDSTISTITTNTNLVLDPNGTGKISFYNAYTFPDTDGSAGYVLTTNGSGTVAWAAASSTLTVKGDAETTEGINLLTETLAILGGEGIDTVIGTNSITISGEDASSTNKGIASFNATDFAVTEGAVTINIERIQDIIGAQLVEGEGIDIVYNDDSTSGSIVISAEIATTTNRGVASFNTNNFTVSNGAVSTKIITLGTSTLTNGSTTTAVTGLTELEIDDIRVDGNTISSIGNDLNIDIVLSPKGTGDLSVDNSKITSVLNPTDPQDAATKAYVDSVAQGLAIKPAVRAATTQPLVATYDNGSANDGVGSTLNLGPLAVLDIDGVTGWNLFDGILIKDQGSTPDGSTIVGDALENGRYFVSQIGSVSVDWILTRCPKCDQDFEIPSMFVFVQEGNTLVNTGWVAVVDDIPGFDVGIDSITFQQFSGAGTYLAGDGLDLDGNTFKVNVAAQGGLEISADNLQLKSGLAGDGLTYLNGVLDVVGTANRISVSANAVDISANYIGQSSITTVGTLTAGSLSTGFTTVAVPQGGTGAVTFTSNGILYGNGTNALQVTAAGPNNYFLYSNNGTPAWTNVIDGGEYTGT